MSLEPKLLKLLCGLIVIVSALWPSMMNAQPPTNRPANADDSPVVARVYGREIHLAEIDARIGNEAYELEKKLFTMRRQSIDDLVTSLLLSHEAERRGETVEQLLNSVSNSAPPPDPAEVDREYAENRPGLVGLGDTVGRYRITLELQAVQRTEAVRKFVAELRNQAGVKMLLQPAHVDFRLAATDCRLGRENAPVQLVEFLDYDCPFCKKLEPTLSSMLQSYASRLSITVKQLPLPIHKTAHNAALAATCAAKQHKFAAFHDRLLASDDHSDGAIFQLAKETGLDAALLSQCMTSGDANSQIEADLADARKLGVEATPSLFLNGTRLEYSDSDDLLRQVISGLDLPGEAGKGEIAGGTR